MCRVRFCNLFLDEVSYAKFIVRDCGCERDECNVHKRSSLLLSLQKDTNVVLATDTDRSDK